MHFINKVSVALLASLAASGEATHQGLHARRFNPRAVNGTSSVLVTPTPLHSSTPSVSPSSSSVVVSSRVSTPLVTGSHGSGAQPTGSGDVTLTYTLGTGTSTSVVTTTVHRTTTDYHTVTVEPVPTSSDACNGATVTVTETETVTVGAGPTDAPGDNGHHWGEGHDHGHHWGEEHHHHHDHDGEGEGNGEGSTVTSISTEVPTSTPTPSFSRPAHGNGTLPSFSRSSVVASSTGFVTSSSAKGSYPTGFRRRYV
ncbi:hypothetical protein N7474_008489 [Penicillium riverlandense]|uniref:uncharacterized protein n=1 Tax=Penicillium riverlandense TaxID=1903569 RepID=UPI002547C14A|nr:uncharacterized protein N7474_008489 [Penicillium riverlandense]KAJ5812188.1 hypothetical protein N7474_008489 [Penicillium riverlandense]